MRKLVRSSSNTCLTDCVARYFNIPPWRVPFFIVKPSWTTALKAYFRRRGLHGELVAYAPKLLANKRKLYLVIGLSPGSAASQKGRHRSNVLYHAVLYRGRKPYFDPNGNQFLKGRPRYVWVTKPSKRQHA